MINEEKNVKTALIICILSFLTWGTLVIYWKQLKSIQPSEIIAHRAFWSLIFNIILVTFLKEWKVIINILKQPKFFFLLICSSLLIGLNWWLYVWSVTNDKVIETSMGYYINPLFNVAAAAIIFKVKLNKPQIIAVLFATTGVLYIIIGYGAVPWVAIMLATTFCFYGVIRKVVPINAVAGLFIETAFITVPAIIYVITITNKGTGILINPNSYIISLLILGGVLTTLPLVGFAYGARRLNLSTVGILQYISPTMSFLIGIFIYNETFTKDHFISFSLIWIGLIIYSLDSVIRYRTLHKNISL